MQGADEKESPHADDTLRIRIQCLLGPTPVLIDNLVREAKAPFGSVQIVLLKLELANRIERHGGRIVLAL